MSNLHFFDTLKKQSAALQEAAKTVINTVCAVKTGERVLIVGNPQKDSAAISMALYDAAVQADARPELIFQNEKTSLDFAEKSVLAALRTEPQVFLSVSSNKLGADPDAMANPYIHSDGQKYDHVFDYNLHAKKCMRAVWMPGITLDMFTRTTMIDYTELKQTCAALAHKMTGASHITVTAPAGTDITIPVQGRKAMTDDGAFVQPGTGGNIPAGEVFISPVVGAAEGRIVFDGSMSLKNTDILINDPIIVDVRNGFVSAITGKAEAQRLLETITAGEEQALQMEKNGALPLGTGKDYKKNARSIGELGIGLNPAAKIKGDMLEDEKAFKTCHFAIGSNYDDDAEALIHLDGVVKLPTITVFYPDGTSFSIEKNGVLNPCLKNLI